MQPLDFIVLFSTKPNVMRNYLLPVVTILALSPAACQEKPVAQEAAVTTVAERQVGGPCECCEAWREGLPGQLSWQTTIAPADEPGESLEVSGVLFQKDGKTPAAGVILYVYHTDNEGRYSRGTGATECARRHGRLRGWMKTDANGRYRFRTIRPASYPNSTAEQHIHPIIKEPGLKEYWIDEFTFDDDPLLTSKVRKRMQNRGGSGILKPGRNAEGVWVAERNIVLGENVPGY